MKKVLFCLSLIFGLLVLNQVPSFAMEVSFETIGGLGDLGYGLIGGATFDFDGTEYTIEDFDNLSEALQQEAADRKAREFLQAYCMARGIPIPNIDPDLPATTGKEFYKSQYFDSANRTVWNNYKLGRTTIEQQEALRFPISPQSFSDWTEYSSFWYKKYISSFESDDIVVPDPDPDYINYINYINADSGSGTDFFFSDWSIENRSLPSFGSPTKYSWVVRASSISNVNNIVNNTNYTQEMYMANGILNAYITGSDTTWIINISGSPIGYQASGFGYCLFRCTNTNIVRIYPGQSSSYYNDGQAYFNVSNKYLTSLAACFDFLKSYKNINIYVNNDPWSIVSDEAPANPTIPEFPDIIGGNSEDPIPAYDIVFPNTSDYEGTFDITSLFDALKEAIIGASDSDDTTDSTLTREKVTDTYRDKVGEAVGEAVKTIDDVMVDSFPLEGTLNYPNLPPIPMIPLDNAFSGTTILSELIDACQQILPSPLALAFWGMIFILFIIGLIRILHK